MSEMALVLCHRRPFRYRDSTLHRSSAHSKTKSTLAEALLPPGADPPVTPRIEEGPFGTMCPVLSPEKILELDRRRVWHPYAPMPGTRPPLVVTAASGVRLRLADGAELVDGMSSWWAAIHGYAHPALDAAAREQLERMSHVMFGGLTHENAVVLCDRLAALAPDGLEHVVPRATRARSASRSRSRCACSTGAPAACRASSAC